MLGHSLDSVAGLAGCMATAYRLYVYVRTTYKTNQDTRMHKQFNKNTFFFSREPLLTSLSHA